MRVKVRYCDKEMGGMMGSSSRIERIESKPNRGQNGISGLWLPMRADLLLRQPDVNALPAPNKALWPGFGLPLLEAG